VVDTPNQIFVHTVEDLIDFSLTKIEHPLNIIPKTPANNFFEPDDFLKEKGFNSECSVLGSENMEYNNEYDE
jgi:hypothetical protein